MTDESQMDAIAPVHATLAEALDSTTVTAFTPRGGQTVVSIEVPRDDYLALVETARGGGFETFIDLCGVDHFGEEPRFEVVANLLSTEYGERVLIKVRAPGDDPTVPTISHLYPGADFYERETWDLLGIVFEGHPDLARLLMPDEWEGHPLRKDYAVGAVPVEFKATR